MSDKRAKSRGKIGILLEFVSKNHMFAREIIWLFTKRSHAIYFLFFIKMIQYSLKIGLLWAIGIMTLCSTTAFWSTLQISTNTGSTKTWTSLTATVTDLQNELEKAKTELTKQLSWTMQRVQKLYDGKVKSLVETPLFKGVECLGYLNSSSSTVDVDDVFAEYQKGILEEYVDISSDIKRLSVGLIKDPQVVKDSITSLQQKFTAELTNIETSYEKNYQQLKADFDAYYSVNQTLVYQVAEKIQKIEILREKYQVLLTAHKELHDTLKQRTRALDIAAAPVKSVTSILNGDLDMIIADYRIKNPEIDFVALETKKEELMKDFSKQLSGFIGILFGSDYNVAKYLDATTKAETFFNTYLQSKVYQCGPLLSAPSSRERTYLSLGEELDALVPWLEKAESKVANWRDDQLEKIDTALEQVYILYYNKAMRTEKSALSKYIMKLIADAYYTGSVSGNS